MGSRRRWRVFVENEAGSNQKNMFDEVTLAWRAAIPLPASYPYPYGFVLGTRGDDGDAIDCYILTEARLAPGTVVEGEVVGLLEQFEDGAADHKVLIALPGDTPVVDAALQERVAAFIGAVFRAVPGARVAIGRLLPAEAAGELLARHEA